MKTLYINITNNDPYDHQIEDIQRCYESGGSVVGYVIHGGDYFDDVLNFVKVNFGTTFPIKSLENDAELLNLFKEIGEDYKVPYIRLLFEDNNFVKSFLPQIPVDEIFGTK